MSGVNDPFVSISESGGGRSVPVLPTGIPAFIGYTETQIYKDRSYHLAPVQLRSMEDYERYFGGAPVAQYGVRTGPGPGTPITLNASTYRLVPSHEVPNGPRTLYYLYYSVKLFFANGGERCWVISVGTYQNARQDWNRITAEDLLEGVATMRRSIHPVASMVVVPDVMALSHAAEAGKVQRALLEGSQEYEDAVALLDVWQESAEADVAGHLDAFQKAIGSEGLVYGAGWYPWLNTRMVNAKKLSLRNIYLPGTIEFLMLFEGPARGILAELIQQYADPGADHAALLSRDHELRNLTPAYEQILKAIAQEMGVLPPAAALAGYIAQNDQLKGVWNTPAGQSLNAVTGPVQALDEEELEMLKGEESGTRLNPILTVSGKGNAVVMGARTLDANNKEFRNLAVIRTKIHIHQNIRAICRAYAQEPNTPLTWVHVINSISQFLTNMWSQGAIWGSGVADAYSVAVGEGETMTSDEVQAGLMRVRVTVAIVQPGEFITLEVEQQLAVE